MCDFAGMPLCADADDDSDKPIQKQLAFCLLVFIPCTIANDDDGGHYGDDGNVGDVHEVPVPTKAEPNQ